VEGKGVRTIWGDKKGGKAEVVGEKASAGGKRRNEIEGNHDGLRLIKKTEMGGRHVGKGLRKVYHIGGMEARDNYSGLRREPSERKYPVPKNRLSTRGILRKKGGRQATWKEKCKGESGWGVYWQGGGSE